MSFYLLSSTFYPRSSILDPRSSILDPRCSILDPRSSIVDPRSSILNPRSSLLDPRSSILDPRSSILDPQSSILSSAPSLSYPTPSCISATKNVDSTFFFLLHSPQLTLKQTSTQRPQTPQSLRRCSHYRRATCPLVVDRESSSLQMTWVSSLNEHGKTVPCLVMFFHGSIFTRQPLCRNRLKSNFQRT